ncbi:MAG TPA: hypothetical protein VGG39_26875 [Polyangiaceae bacterium]|jgi:hypothetical protein
MQPITTETNGTAHPPPASSLLADLHAEAVQALESLGEARDGVEDLVGYDADPEQYRDTLSNLAGVRRGLQNIAASTEGHDRPAQASGKQKAAAPASLSELTQEQRLVNSLRGSYIGDLSDDLDQVDVELLNLRGELSAGEDSKESRRCIQAIEGFSRGLRNTITAIRAGVQECPDTLPAKGGAS